jgi:hypothetical protein
VAYWREQRYDEDFYEGYCAKCNNFGFLCPECMSCSDCGHDGHCQLGKIRGPEVWGLEADYR